MELSNTKLRNPYIGPRPFEREDRAFFFGRDREANELASLIISHPLVVLYAQSGAGKTSLLNTQVVSMLDDEGFDILPFARVQGVILQNTSTEDIHNIYTYNTILSWRSAEADQPKETYNQTLAEFLGDRPRQTDEDGYQAARIIVFDQFEELFSAYPERWQDREKFLNQINNALQADPLLRVVLSLREDYVAELVQYLTLFPEILRTFYHIERLRPEQALEAIEYPLQGTGRTYTPNATKKIVGELRKIQVQSISGETTTIFGEFIEPVQLQVVCQNLWEDLPVEVTVIDTNHIDQFGDVNQALTHFYERAIAKTNEVSRISQNWMRSWFDKYLITPAGTRGFVYRGTSNTGGLANKVVDQLEDLHIVRSEIRAGSRWIELTHDRLIEPIRQSNRDRNRRRRRRNTYLLAVIALIGLIVLFINIFLEIFTVTLLNHF